MKALLITIDSLRKDHLGCYGYKRNTTPFLDSFAEQNLVFENAYSPSPHTREAIPSILTGKKPEDAVNKTNTGIELKGETIPDKIPKEVRSSGITSGVYLTPFENHDQGFDRFSTDYTSNKSFTSKYLKYLKNLVKNQQFRTGEEINKEVIRSLKESQDSFVWAHYMDAHHPYNNFDKWHWGSKISRRKIQFLFRKANHAPSLISEKGKETMINVYDNSIRALDKKLEKLFDKIPEETKVFITSDHGESFGEKNDFEHPRKLKDYLLEVPLMISSNQKKNENGIISTREISPMIESLFNSEEQSVSENLNRGNRGKVAVSCIKGSKRVRKFISQD